MAVNAQMTYQQNQITTATSQDLVLLLYGGGIKYLKLANRAIEEKKMEEAHNYLIRAQDILSELELGLNRDIEIANQLYSLYEFMKNHLTQANVKKDTNMINDVIGFLEDLRVTWKQAMEIAKKETVKR